jgi:hypothetical protein
MNRCTEENDRSRPAMCLIGTDDSATRAGAFPSSVAVVLQDKVQADTFASDIKLSTFTLIDAARRGEILAKVKNYGLIRWHSRATIKSRAGRASIPRKSNRNPSKRVWVQRTGAERLCFVYEIPSNPPRPLSHQSLREYL